MVNTFIVLYYCLEVTPLCLNMPFSFLTLHAWSGRKNKTYNLKSHPAGVPLMIRQALLFKARQMSVTSLSSRTIAPLTSNTSSPPASVSIEPGHICTLNYLDCHLYIFNGPVSFFPFMVQSNTTVSTALYQLVWGRMIWTHSSFFSCFYLRMLGKGQTHRGGNYS